MSEPRLLDLFCCAGGGAVGYHRAGFRVTGVDHIDQPNYPFEFIKQDALDLDPDFLAGFDAIHASPPCQAYSVTVKRTRNGDAWPKLIGPIRDMLRSTGKPYVIENVVGAPLISPTLLCGTMFPSLRVIRHRLFETNFPLPAPEHMPHKDHPLCHTLDKRKAHYGKTNDMINFVSVVGGGNCSIRAARDAMGIDWMRKSELNEAIPPLYTEWVGKFLMRQIRAMLELVAV